MYCFRCGRKLPGGEINCPDCDTPKKRRQRRHKRMILGLFIFLSGAFVGSLFDSYIFKGEAWKHSILNSFFGNVSEKSSEPLALPENATATIKIEVGYGNGSDTANKKVEEPDSQPFSERDNIKKTDDIKKNIEPIKEKVEDKTAAITVKNEASEPLKPEILPAMDKKSEAALDLAVSVEDGGKEDDDVVITLEHEETDFSEKSKEIVKPEQSQKNLVYKGISLLESEAGDSYHPFLSNNSEEMIFASNRLKYKGKPTFQCFIKQPSGNASANRLFEWPGNIWTPEFTSDSNMIVFSSDSAKPEHIFLYDRKSKNSMALTSGESKNMMPCISPDGKRIAFVSNRSGKYCIWLMDLLDKSKLVQVTKGNVNDREPRWLPNGKGLVFTRIIENMKVSHIMSVALDPISEPKALVSAKSRNWMPSLSPDSSLLAYTRSLNPGGSKNSIVLQEMSSGKEEILSFPNIYESFRPVWVSDGSGFLFHAAQKSGKAIFKANFLRE